MGFVNGYLVRATLQATHASGRTHVNTLHYDGRGTTLDAITTADIQPLADRLRDDLLGPYKALYDSGWVISPIIVSQEKDPLNPTAPRAEAVSGTAGNGTNSGGAGTDPLPPALCAVATLKTSHIGRRATGRMFLGGSLFETAQNGGVWGSTFMTLWQAFLDAIPHAPDLITGPDFTDGVHWCVYSRTSRAQSVAQYASDVTSPILRSKVHWLRSRES